MDFLVKLAAKNLKDILNDAVCLASSEGALVVYDNSAPLAKIFLEAYRQALPNGEFLDFNASTPEEIKQKINACKAGDIVILLQSTNFRLNEFRLRIELFQRGLKTIEHLHLARMSEDQFERYINALAYDKNYYRALGPAIKNILDSAKEIIVTCAGTKLVYSGAMESAKLNIGDYSAMKNVGGTYPIGEVFTEAKDLATVNGQALIFGFAGEDHLVRIVKPFKVIIEKGILTAVDAPEEFEKILKMISANEQVFVREFGLGLNPAVGKNALVSDITAFERQKGMHLSLGAKHGVYAKEGLHKKKSRYHIDVFVDIEIIEVDGKTLYKEGDFIFAN